MIKRIRPAKAYRPSDDPLLKLSRSAMRSVARDLRASFASFSQMMPVKEVENSLRHGRDPRRLINWHHYREALKSPFARLHELRSAAAKLGARQINGAFNGAGRKVRYRKAASPMKPWARTKATHEQSNYRPGNEDCSCGECTMFMPPLECTAVESPVTAGGLCDFFQDARFRKATADSFTFDSLSPEVQAAVRNAQDALIQQLESDARDAIETIISDGVAEGTDMADIAANVRDMIGLTDTQSQAVLNYQQALYDLDPQALSRGLRNVDYDAMVQDAIDSGTDLSDDSISNMVDDYIENYLDYRAATIASTESSRASAAGLHDAYSQAIDRGALTDDAVTRHWLLGDNPCPICESIADNSEPDGVGVDEAFDSDDGPVDDPPVHPSCECSVDYVTDLDQVPDDSETEYEYQTQGS